MDVGVAAYHIAKGGHVSLALAKVNSYRKDKGLIALSGAQLKQSLRALSYTPPP